MDSLMDFLFTPPIVQAILAAAGAAVFICLGALVAPVLKEIELWKKPPWQK
jgi:hypothetical protein